MSATLQRGRDGRWRLGGKLDFASVAALQPRLGEALQHGDALDIDLSGVTRTNSAGLALLLQWQEDAARRGVALRILHPPKSLIELARLSNLEQVLAFADT